MTVNKTRLAGMVLGSLLASVSPAWAQDLGVASVDGPIGGRLQTSSALTSLEEIWASRTGSGSGDPRST